jgi:hypothetical protein
MFEKEVVEKIEIHIFCSIFFPPENHAIHDIIRKNTVERGRLRMMIIWRMRIACWIPTATNTQSEYVIIIAFPLQQWLHEYASLLRYVFIVFLFRKSCLF